MTRQFKSVFDAIARTPEEAAQMKAEAERRFAIAEKAWRAVGPAPWSQRFRRCKEFARKRRKHSKWRQFFVALWASRLKEMGAAVDEINGRLP